MNGLSGTLSAIAVGMALVASSSAGRREARYDDLPNFHKVNAKLYRGAQPRRDGFKKLAELGIKSIIDLRGEGNRSHRERAAAEAAGLHYFNVPLPNLGSPSDQQVARLMAIIDEPQNQPVFVHCRRGSDRTGTVIACYRISREGWTSDRAISEAKLYGMSWTEFAMRSYISGYYKRQRSRQGLRLVYLAEPAAIIGASRPRAVTRSTATTRPPSTISA